MDLLVNKSYDQFSAIFSMMVLNGLNFEFSSFMNFLVNLRTNSVGYIAYISRSICESCAQHTILFNTVGLLHCNFTQNNQKN